MKLWVLSDLHLRTDVALAGAFQQNAIPEADVAVVAGDVTDGVEESLHFLSRAIAPHMPVIAILGNHEFYGWEHGRARREARRFAERHDRLHVLDDSEVAIGGVRFLGGTLWTNYSLYAEGDQRRIRHSMAIARRLMPDHCEIDADAPAPGVISRRWLPSDALRAHSRTVEFLQSALSLNGGPTVVVSHHAPHPKCVSPRHEDAPLTPAFVSDLSGLIATGTPQLWVHGHVHNRVDARVGRTRIICNPHGYAEHNCGFDPRLVVEL